MTTWTPKTKSSTPTWGKASKSSASSWATQAKSSASGGDLLLESLSYLLLESGFKVILEQAGAAGNIWTPQAKS